MKKHLLSRIIFCCVTACLISACNGSTSTQEPTKPITTTSATPVMSKSPFAQSAYKVEWANYQLPSEVEAGKVVMATATLKNASDTVWPAKLTSGTQVIIGLRWFTKEGKLVKEGGGPEFPHDVAPGETITLDKIPVTAPDKPGSYTLRLTLAHQGVRWFEAMGASTVEVPVTVR